MKKVGQPKKNIIDVLQTIFWYRYIEIRVVANIYEQEFYEINGNEISSIELYEKIDLLEKFQSSKLNKHEVMFYKTNPNKIGLSFKEGEARIWYKYAKGMTKPNAVKLKRVDKVIENASLYFKHPIWKFLKKRPCDKAELDSFFSSFEKCSIEAINAKLIQEPSTHLKEHSIDGFEFMNYGKE